LVRPRLGLISALMGVFAVWLASTGCRHTGLVPIEVDAAPDAGDDARQIPAPDAGDDAWQIPAPDSPVDVRELGEPDAAALPDAGAEAVSEDTSRADSSDTTPICSGICNAVTPSYPTVGPDAGQGNITMYTTEASGGGACNYGVTKVLYFVAVNVNVSPGDGQGHWQGGRVCGQCVEVTALTTQGPQSVVVRIMDKCPDGYCGMDLGGAAPAAVMRDGFGRYAGSWRFVSCVGHPEVSDGPTSLCVSSGANAYWSRVQVRNPPGAVESIAWRDSQGTTGTFPYASDPENTFEVPPSVLQSTVASITVTARFTDGSTATVDLAPGQLAVENASYVMK
jgi:hypothetical protein